MTPLALDIVVSNTAHSFTFVVEYIDLAAILGGRKINLGKRLTYKALIQ